MRRAAWGTVLAAVVFAVGGQLSSALAAFPGENGKILFVRSNQDYLDYRLHFMQPDGSGITRTDVGGLRSTTDPEWSPDGSRIVLARGGGFLVTDANGDEVTTVRPGWGHVDNPSWSPDGRQLLYEFEHITHCDRFLCYGSSGIRRINLDGSGDTGILEYGHEPAWSPDGDKIAFVASGNQGFGDIYVMNVDGSGVTNLTNHPSPDEDPTWSPDGQSIAFERWHGSNFNIEVHVMTATGGGQVNITNNPLPEGNAAWSPDGSWILFNRAGVIYRTDPTGRLKTYVSGDGHDGNPDWQPLILNQAPDCAGVAADPASLWPPNKHLRTVTLSGASDPDGDDVTLRVTGVTHDEGGASDWQAGASADEVQLRAARDPKGDGRVYEIAFEATDEHGATCTGETTVTVPRHKR